jgi:hypothetical protein
MCSLENGDLAVGHGDFTRDMSANGIKWVCLKKGILGQNVTCVLPFFFGESAIFWTIRFGGMAMVPIFRQGLGWRPNMQCQWDQQPIGNHINYPCDVFIWLGLAHVCSYIAAYIPIWLNHTFGSLLGNHSYIKRRLFAARVWLNRVPQNPLIDHHFLLFIRQIQMFDNRILIFWDHRRNPFVCTVVFFFHYFVMVKPVKSPFWIGSTIMWSGNSRTKLLLPRFRKSLFFPCSKITKKISKSIVDIAIYLGKL